MFGIHDFWIWSAYLLCILSTVLCVIYGALMWNRGAETTPSKEDMDWAAEEDKISEEL